MSFTELILLAIGLSMDAFAVSVTNGMCKKNINLKWSVYIALTFGIFQGLMPCIGFILGNTFIDYISKYDHWIALILLGAIGAKMIIDGIRNDDSDEKCSNEKLTISALLIQGIATSIDALAVGVSLAAINTNIVFSASIICIITTILSFSAVYIGKKAGDILNKKAQIIGGLILVAIGIKIFIQHIFFS